MDHLSVFIRVVEAGSFTAAARITGTTPSSISKSMARLEARLGIRLFKRSTRAFGLTPEGAIYFERVAPLVRGIEEAGDEVSGPAAATGQLRISVPADFGRLLVNALTCRFLEENPGVRLDLSMSDRHVDVIREGYDGAVRVGYVADTGLIARPLGVLSLVLVASPQYLGRRGMPESISALGAHDHVRYMLAGRPFPIAFERGDFVPPTGPFDADSGEALRLAAVNGLGIVQILRASVHEELLAGRLVPVLADHALRPVPIQILHAFSRIVPLRVRALFDFLDLEIGRLRSL
ncbi:LysR family transcriptional regulator [Sphingomonas sp. H39-1-10]|uniref:LysR family transcriptional regulator n=1 Tax=Sphingomonas pollutisoli TaxID=3030829 RepID=UPI0023B9D8E2|nr:LysR family transcriptional regulator [Sphingomonas pollutisoli]MDF0489967.1 LysR family transcriptional regulator [Sphingomonas pollutisoli]